MFVEEGYKTEKLLRALNKLAQSQSLHPRYILYIWWYSFILNTQLFDVDGWVHMELTIY